MKKLLLKFYTLPVALSNDAILFFIPPSKHTALPSGVYCVPEQNECDVYNYKSYVEFMQHVDDFTIDRIKLNGNDIDPLLESHAVMENDVFEIELSYSI